MSYALAFAALLLAFAAVLLALTLARARRRERRLLALLDQLPDIAVTVFDGDLRSTEVHGGAFRESGIDRAAIVGKRVDEIYGGGSTGDLVAQVHRALEGHSESVEFTSPATGREYWIRVAPLIEDDEIVGGLSVAQNVSDLRQAERDLSAEARRRFLILDSMNEAYVANDASGIVTEWNRAAAETFGYSAAEAIGSPLAELIIPERDRNDFFEVLTRGRPDSPESGRHDIRAERRALHRDGHEFPVELAATLVEVGDAVELHSLMHDISDRKLAMRELRQHAADVEALAEAVGEIARSSVARDARAAICRSAIRVAGASIGVLFEPDPSGTGLRVTGAEGPGSAGLAGKVVTFTERAGSTAAFASRELVFVSRIEDNPAVEQAIFGDTGAASVLWVAVRSGEQAIGVVAVGWSEPLERLEERHERLMGVMSAEAAVAIERAALLDRLERMALTDELTGLINRRAWDVELSRERLRATRDGAPLAVAMLDLDRFKAYNDRLGHQAGDRFLRQAASAWRAALRETDLLARYGGEEFAVALPGCDAAYAEELVERLREGTPEGESCSAGVACWDGVETAEALVGRADHALYAAKQRGRDRTIVA